MALLKGRVVSLIMTVFIAGLTLAKLQVMGQSTCNLSGENRTTDDPSVCGDGFILCPQRNISVSAGSNAFAICQTRMAFVQVIYYLMYPNGSRGPSNMVAGCATISEANIHLCLNDTNQMIATACITNALPTNITTNINCSMCTPMETEYYTDCTNATLSFEISITDLPAEQPTSPRSDLPADQPTSPRSDLPADQPTSPRSDAVDSGQPGYKCFTLLALAIFAIITSYH